MEGMSRCGVPLILRFKKDRQKKEYRRAEV